MRRMLRRVLSAGVRGIAAMGVVGAVAGCGVLAGDEASPTPYASWTREPRPLEALAEEVVCGVFAKNDLAQHLGYQASYYRLRTSPAGQLRGDWYLCLVEPFESGNLWTITVNYSLFDDIWVPEGDPDLRFDGISAAYPGEAQPLVFGTVEGEGWVWVDDRTAYVAWRYPTGYVLTASMKTATAPTAEQIAGFRAVMEPALGQIPGLAAGPAQAEEVSAPTGVPTPSRSGSPGSTPTP